jgi:MFS family permease
MLPILTSVSSIFAAVLLFMLGNSLLGITLQLKMEAAGFANELTGMVMAAYFAGLLTGCVYGKRLIFRVGHIRAFAGLSALNVSAILCHAMVFDPLPWAVLRFVSGLSIAGIFSALESWLNDRLDNANRGRVLGVYMVINYCAMALGQLSINVWPLDTAGCFIAAAFLVSLAIVPVALTRTEAPSLAKAAPVTLAELYRISPLAVAGAVFSGLMLGAFWGLGAVFGRQIGFSVFETSLFTGSYIVGGLLLQIPIGRLSDRFDRRTVLCNVLAAAVMVCVAGLAAGRLGDPLPLVLALAALLGGAISNVYPLSIAQAFDYLDRARYVAGASRMLMAYGVGAVAGPLVCSIAMSWLGPHAFFGYIGLVAGVLAAFVLYRMGRREALPVEEQREFVALPRMSPVVATLHPDAKPATAAVAEDEPAPATPATSETAAD